MSMAEEEQCKVDKFWGFELLEAHGERESEIKREDSRRQTAELATSAKHDAWVESEVERGAAENEKKLIAFEENKTAYMKRFFDAISTHGNGVTPFGGNYFIGQSNDSVRDPQRVRRQLLESLKNKSTHDQNLERGGMAKLSSLSLSYHTDILSKSSRLLSKKASLISNTAQQQQARPFSPLLADSEFRDQRNHSDINGHPVYGWEQVLSFHPLSMDGFNYLYLS